MKYIATILFSSLLALYVLTATADPQMGSTSSWGVVYSPCQFCQSTNNLEVHHIFCQHIWPELSRNTNNMVVLCRRCHFTIGHKNNWARIFTNVMAVIKAGKTGNIKKEEIK